MNVLSARAISILGIVGGSIIGQLAEAAAIWPAFCFAAAALTIGVVVLWIEIIY